MRFVTLTLAVDGKPLAERIDRLYAAFKRLRDTALWRDSVEAGIAVCEVTLGSKRQWHVHLHVLVSGKFIPQKRLSAEWHGVTGDSFIVHIEAVHDRRNAARYVADYVGKPPELMTLTDDEIIEYADAMHGRRLLLTVGKKPAKVNDEDDAPDVREPAVFVVNTNHVERCEAAGMEHVTHAADILARLSRSLAFALDRNVPDESLPPVTPQEWRWALHVFDRVNAATPGMPTADELERARCTMFGEPAPPPPSRLVQLRLQYAGPGTVPWD